MVIPSSHFSRLQPPPMPEVAVRLTSLPDLQKAVARVGECWNPTQLDEALRSVRFWLEKLEQPYTREDLLRDRSRVSPRP